MHNLYSFLVHIVWYVLHLIAQFKPKIKLFVNGRKKAFAQLEKALKPKDKVVWMHVASLGEYEQGLPILKKLRIQYPNHKLLLTFFSPSGYEIKKNTNTADIITYLPLDTINNAQRFLELANPRLAIFVKYEIWPNYLKELKKREIPALLISALFSKRQVYFKWYGGFMRKSLNTFHQIFVQDENSKKLLKNVGFTNVLVSGDTRFDRVSEILGGDNKLAFMEKFKQVDLCFVAGSTWPEDEEVLVDFINRSDKKIQYVIAPHNIKKEHVKKLKSNITKKVICFSELENKSLNDYDVLLIDTIGLLTKIYSYANIAYVGGGFKTGLHNTLEPAVFGIPILIGPMYIGFKEAEELVKKGGIIPVRTKLEFSNTLNNLLENDSLLSSKGKITSHYVSSNKGATHKIMGHIKDIMQFS